MLLSESFSPAPNAADWTGTIEVLDDETGTAFDLTGLLIEIEVRDQGGCRRLYGSTIDGLLTIEAGVGFSYDFPVASLRNICAGSYTVNIRITDPVSGDVAEPVIANLPILEGGYR